MIKRIVNTSPGWDNPSDSEGLFLSLIYLASLAITFSSMVRALKYSSYFASSGALDRSSSKSMPHSPPIFGVEFLPLELLSLAIAVLSSLLAKSKVVVIRATSSGVGRLVMVFFSLQCPFLMIY